MQDVWNRILKHKGCPDTSSTPENTYKTAMTSIDYFAASEFSTVIDTVASPIDGLADKYMQKNLSAGAYSAYQVGGAFLLADSGPLTKRLVGYAQKVSASDPAMPPTDKATLNADMEATSSIAVADALDSSSVNVPQTSTSGVNLTSFDNQLNSLTNQLLTLANVLQT